MAVYFQKNTPIPTYMAFPIFLFSLPIPNTARIIYMLLLDRAKLSRKNGGWADDCGRIYINYTIEHLAKTLGKRESCIKAGLKILSDMGLIIRQQQGVGRANRIYVLVPEDKNPTGILPKKRLGDSRILDDQGAGKPPGNHVIESGNLVRTNDLLGTYHNVRLSGSEREYLKNDIPNWKDYVERLSCYMASNGKTYENHAATIRLWATKDKGTREERTYDKEDAL